MKFKGTVRWLGLLGAWIMLGAWSSNGNNNRISSPPVFPVPSASINDFRPAIAPKNSAIIHRSSLSPVAQSLGNPSTLVEEEEEDNFAVLEAVTLTIDSVILKINGQQTAANLKIDPRTNRLSLIMEGVKLADSIPINQDNAGPDGTLSKRRLRIKQLKKGIVEVSINAQEQGWTVNSHAQGLQLSPTAIASNITSVETAPEVSPGELSSGDVSILSETTETVAEGEAVQTTGQTTTEQPNVVTQIDGIDVITGPTETRITQGETTVETTENGEDNIQTEVTETKETEVIDTAEFEPESPVDGAAEDEVTKPEISSPLLRQPIRLLHLNTANQLLRGESIATYGQTQSVGSQAGGTGNQSYFSYSNWGITDNLQLGWGYMINDDPTYNQINGVNIPMQYQSMGPNIKYQLYQDKNLGVGVFGAIEQLQIYSGPGLFNNYGDPTLSNTFAGTIQIPISYNLSDNFQVTFTPGVNFYSNSLNAVPFYGTVANVGFGASWQALKDLSLFANTVIPLSGGNSFTTSREITKTPIWSVGGTYTFNKAVAIEAHVTNSFGGTPVTGVLTLPTSPNEILVGGQLVLSPSAKEINYVDYDDRQTKLLFDWFTLTTPYVLPTDDFGVRLAGDSEGSIGGGLYYGFLQDYQIDLAFYSVGGFNVQSVLQQAADTATNWRLGGKLEYLNQAKGDPLSLSGRVSIGRDFGNKQGYAMLEFPLMYEFNNRWAAIFSPKAGINGGNTPVGIGLGINYQAADWIQLIGEITPLITGERLVWAAGVRLFPLENLAIDLLGTNSTTQFDMGELIAGPDTRFSASIQWRFGKGTNNK